MLRKSLNWFWNLCRTTFHLVFTWRCALCEWFWVIACIPQLVMNCNINTKTNCDLDFSCISLFYSCNFDQKKPDTFIFLANSVPWLCYEAFFSCCLSIFNPCVVKLRITSHTDLTRDISDYVYWTIESYQ